VGRGECGAVEHDRDRKVVTAYPGALMDGERVDDDELYSELLEWLRSVSAASAAREGPIVISDFDGETFAQPLRLHVTPESLGRHLRNRAPESGGAFPDVDPVVAAFRLFLVHVEEAVRARRPDQRELVLSDTGVRAAQS